MSNSKLPILTEKLIQQMADPQSFKRGKEYYMDGVIEEPISRGNELSGECCGSRPHPYRVSVTFNDRSIQDAFCTCPRGGFCKHIVALLLTYAHEAKLFREVPSLENMLDRLSKQELITLIRDMVDREPSLISLAEISASISQRAPDESAYRREAQLALQREYPGDIEADLRGILRLADRLAKKNDWIGAGTIYYTVLNALVENYDDELLAIDEEGDIAVIASDCADILSDCIKHGRPDGPTRQIWLKTLLEAELANIEMGGIDFAPSAFETVLEYTHEKEWPPLEEQILAAIKGSSDWARGHLIKLIAAWREKHGRYDEAGEIIRELGTPEQRMLLMVSEGKPDDAVAMARQHFLDKPGIINDLADALVHTGFGDSAVSFLTDLTESGNSHWSYLEWLVKNHQGNGNWEAAMKCQSKFFLLNPGVKSFKVLRDISKKMGLWENVRTEVLQKLEAEKKTAALLDIALYEGNVKRSLDLLPHVQNWWWNNYKVKVAGAAEKEYPQQAIILYKELAEEAIGRRKRDTYREAAGYLKRIKNISRHINEKHWEDYISSLKIKYARLPALQDEIKRAGI